MNKKILVSALAAALAACGSGSDSSAGSGDGGNGAGGGKNGGGSSVQTGSVSGLSGVAYATATQSGVLNASGSFSYQPGETLTLTLGGITLGSAAADANMKLTDFLGKLPATAAEFRTQMRVVDQGRERFQVLEREVHYAMSVKSDLHKAANLLSVLMGLDGDGDISTGLDLSTGDWNKKLADVANKDLNLHYHLLDQKIDYALHRLQQKHGFSLVEDKGELVSQLYKLAGITLTAKPLTSITSSRKKTFTYDEKNRLKKTEETSVGSDGSISHFETFEYFDNGLLKKVTERRNVGPDGKADRKYVRDYIYNAYGKIKTYGSLYYGNGEDNAVTRHTEGHNTYLNDRILIATNRRVDKLRNDLDHTLTTYSYDDSSLLLNKQVSEDRNRVTDAKTKTNLIYVYTVNADGLRTHFKRSQGFNGGEPGSVLNITTLHSGNKITDQWRQSYGSNKRNPEIFSQTVGVDGKISEKYAEIRALDDNKLLAKNTAEFQYQADKGITQCIKRYDSDGDGTTNSAERGVWTMGAHGFTKYVTESDRDGDGNFETKDGSDWLVQYGQQGELTQVGYDGEEQRTFQYGNEAVSDGARYLVTEYDQVGRDIFDGPHCTITARIIQ